MNIESERRDGISFLTVTGRIDGHAAPQFELFLTDAVARGEHGVVVDFSAVEYVSSAALRAVLVGARAAKARKRTIALYGLTEFVNEVFSLSGFDKIVPLVETEEEAIKAVVG